MDCNSQFELWKDQVRKLKSSMSSLSETEPRNVLQHFFLQAAQSELKSELEPVKNLLKEIQINPSFGYFFICHSKFR